MTFRKIAVITALLFAGCASASAGPASANAETDLGCGNEQDFSVTVKPHDCFLNWPNLSLAESVGLHRLTWHSWGSSAATAKAVFRVKVYERYTHVTVRAFARRKCGPNSYLYTRVRVHFPRGVTHTWSTPDCTDIDADY